MRSLLVTALSTLVCGGVAHAQTSIATWFYNFSTGSAPQSSMLARQKASTVPTSRQ